MSDGSERREHCKAKRHRSAKHSGYLIPSSSELGEQAFVWGFRTICSRLSDDPGRLRRQQEESG